MKTLPRGSMRALSIVGPAMGTAGVSTTGAMPCVGLLKLDDITEQLKDYDIVLVRT
jgi:hypothetical protein